MLFVVICQRQNPRDAFPLLTREGRAREGRGAGRGGGCDAGCGGGRAGRRRGQVVICQRWKDHHQTRGLPQTAELELELIQPHMAQKPVLRGEVGCACDAREVSVEKGATAPHPHAPQGFFINGFFIVAVTHEGRAREGRGAGICGGRQDVAQDLAFGARAARALIATTPPPPPPSLCSSR